MDKNTTGSDVNHAAAIVNTLSGESEVEEKLNGPKAGEVISHENIQVNELMCDEFLPTEIGEVESSKCVEGDIPNTTSVETPQDASILRVQLMDGTIDENSPNKVKTTKRIAAKSTRPVVDEKSVVGTGSDEILDKESPCDDDVTNDNVLPFLNKADVPCDSDGSASERGSKTSEVIELDQDKNSVVIELDQDKNSVVIELDQDSNSAVEGNKSPEVTKNFAITEENNGENIPESEVDITHEDSPSRSNGERNERTNTEFEMLDIDSIALDVKLRRRGKQKRDSHQSDQSVIENGTPNQEDEDLNDSNVGRPRRKAAKKAGDQIRQMVGIEDEEVTELVDDRRKETEDWTTGTGSPPRKICFQCCRLRSCQYHLLVNGVSRYMCTTPCFQAFRKQHPPKTNPGKNNIEIDPKGGEIASPVDAGGGGDVRLGADGRPVEGKERILECAFCHLVVLPPTSSEKSLSWETMEFCNEDCLGKYQDQLGSNCSQCKVQVQRISMGKYCVRFGYNIKQFCCSTCLEEFKKGLKACTYCQKDISTGAEGFLAPVGDKGQFKDFCSPACMEQYDHISSGTRPTPKEAACAVCDKVRTVILEVVTGRLGKEPLKDNAARPPITIHSLCSEPCFAAFKFVNEVKTEQCESCHRYFDTSKPEEKPTTFFHDGGYHTCCRACLNIFILTRRSIVQCNWCRVKKYDFDMIKRISSSGQVLMMCSLNCLSLYHVSISAVSSRRVRCDFCGDVSQAQYHLTMSDATVRNFCSYECVMTFQSQYSKTPLTLPEEDMTLSPQNSVTGLPPHQASSQRSQPVTVQSGPVPASGVDTNMPPIPVISSVQSLASADRNIPKEIISSPVSGNLIQPGINHANSGASKVTVASNGLALQQVIVRPPNLKAMRNKATNCKPFVSSKSVDCRPTSVDSSSQTEAVIPSGPVLIPVPVPIYVPMPMHMYSSPFPIPVPFPLPIPVPIIIPAKLSVEEILKRSKEIPSMTQEEAEILMMAELVVAGEEPKEIGIKSEEPGNSDSPIAECEETDTTEVLPDSEAGGRVVVSFPSSNQSVDLEKSIAVSTMHGPAYNEGEFSTDEPQENERNQGRKRKANERGRVSKTKRSRTTLSQHSEEEEESTVLKASLGVSAWQVWVQQKNSELSKVTSNSRRLKLFKTELLQMTLEELNYALCLFVKEVRKPGGGMYAPDTILYFCFGIQHYLMENGRVDNIFTDLYFEKFTECLDQVAKTFPPLTRETRIITTRVEEEHLWESRQLGAHSPYVLLSTLVFFNTKYFRLWSVEDHAKLTFTNVVKVWRKSRGRQQEAAKAGPSSNRSSNHFSLLRYIHPDKLLDEESLERRVYEQHENITTPLRCPVKLYEFYLSKCPDPIKRCGDVFYLLPERACVPDSPVWYSSTALGPDALGKILHRIQMVKEVNKAYISELAEELPAVICSSEKNKEEPVDVKEHIV